jgi:nucleoid-associated protein YgaU
MRYYTVKYGDTLATIAQRFYGNKELAMVIYRHNSHIIQNPNQLNPGQKISIPHIPRDSGVL